MKTKESGFIGIIIIVILALAAVGGGAYIYDQNEIVHNDVDFNNEIQKGLEVASSTSSNKNVTIGVTAKTKTPITAEVSMKSDSQGNEVPSIVVDQNAMNKAVVEKYGNNSVYINKNLKLIAGTAFLSFATEQAESVWGREGTYSNVCKSSNLFIEAMIRGNLDRDLEDGGLLTALGISLNSFRINEIVCKADKDNYIITMPVTLENGTAAKVCSSSSGQYGFIGDANYETYTCIKK